jgi:hypothetical protein
MSHPSNAPITWSHRDLLSTTWSPSATDVSFPLLQVAAPSASAEMELTPSEIFLERSVVLSFTRVPGHITNKSDSSWCVL